MARVSTKLDRLGNALAIVGLFVFASSFFYESEGASEKPARQIASFAGDSVVGSPGETESNGPGSAKNPGPEGSLILHGCCSAPGSDAAAYGAQASQTTPVAPVAPAAPAAPSIPAIPAIPGSPPAPFMRWLVAPLIEAAAVFVRFRRAVRLWLPFLLIVPLFARLSRQGVLQHPTRKKILDVVEAEPGLSTQDIRRRCDLAWSEARYHLELLLSHGVLDEVRWGRNRNWFAAHAAGFEAQRKAAALNRPGAKALFEAIRSSPGSSPAKLARNLNVHHSTIAYHISWLERADLVRREQDGRSARCYPA